MAKHLELETVVPLEPSVGSDCQLPLEDGGKAMILERQGLDGLFVRVQSWDETKQHKAFSTLKGKRARLALEAI